MVVAVVDASEDDRPMAECEHCNTELDEPDHTQTVPGYDGPIELWFCEDCTNV